MANGISKTKFCKNGHPKRAGNFWCGTGTQTRDYPVNLINGELIVGERTPLAQVMPSAAALAINDPYFDSYTQRGTHTHRGEQYPAEKLLIKNRYSMNMFTYRELITTYNEFKYTFPEY